MSMKRSQYVEQCLKCKLPCDYKKFIDKYGYGIVNNLEIFGYSEDTVDIDKFPCVIGMTNKYRLNGVILDNEIAIAVDDDYVYGYSLLSNSYFKKSIEGVYINIKTPFGGIE